MRDDSSRGEIRVRIPVPRLDGGLVTNLAALAGLLMIVLAVGALADWRWALLLAGGLTFAAAVWAQRSLPATAPAIPAAEPATKPTAVRAA